MIKKLGTRSRALVIVLVAALALVGAFTLGAMTRSDSDADAIRTVQRLVGDDNLDGSIYENETGWRCETMGSGLCSPTSVETQQLLLLKAILGYVEGKR